MGIGGEAFYWGILSAISLPLGALLGLLWRPQRKINSAFMAFGAGALLFALSIELFGHVPHHVEQHGYFAFLAAITGAITGGLLFDLLNGILNNRGAFLRRFSQAKAYVYSLKMRRSKELVEELSKVRCLRAMTPEEMSQLVLRVHRQTFRPGEFIFKQGDASDEMYFIISGDVDVVHHGRPGTHDVSQERHFTLHQGDIFGEIGVLTGDLRTADIRAITDVRTYKISKDDFDDVIEANPKLQQEVSRLAAHRLNDLEKNGSEDVLQENDWIAQIHAHLDRRTHGVSSDDIHEEFEMRKKGGGAALAIWLGIMIDGVPESLVIGMLANSAAGMSLAFIAGVFLANLPEAMSSAVTMRDSGMGIKKIFLMWGSITLLTGIGAAFGAIIFPADPQGNLFYLVLGIEGLAAGAMLTMIAETMLPEAFEQGGSIVGLSTLAGFISALAVKLL